MKRLNSLLAITRQSLKVSEEFAPWPPSIVPACQGCYLQHAMLGPTMWSGFPRSFIFGAHDGGKCSRVRAKAAHVSGHLPGALREDGVLAAETIDAFLMLLQAVRVPARADGLDGDAD